MFFHPLKALLQAATLAIATSSPAQDALPPEFFPYEVITVPGVEAYQTWQDLSQRGDMTPIIIGDDNDLIRTAEPFHPDYSFGETPEQSLAKAKSLSHPASIDALRQAEREEFRAWARAEGKDELADMLSEAETLDADLIGTWPLQPEINPGLLSLTDYRTGGIMARVHIALLPTTDPTEAPALLRFGGWNANPLPEYHVAALRSWRDRYGAVPVMINGDVIELAVSRRPANATEAMAIAREQFSYNEDIVYQGVGTLAALAASLHASDWWYFWWD